MKINKLIVSIAASILVGGNLCAQGSNPEVLPESTGYRIEAFGSIAKDKNVPFWMVSNRYGIVPLDADNGYLRAGLFHSQRFGSQQKFYWNAGIDLVAAVPRYRNVYVQQLFAELGYRDVLLSIGSKETYTSLWDRNLSSGDLVHSANSRPLPEINLSIPQFVVVPLTKGWLQVKGDFAVGRSFDSAFLERQVRDVYYIEHTLWHHKSLYLRINDSRSGKPLSAVLGVQHWAQWGGTSNNPALGKQPRSFKDFLRIVACKEGGGSASVSDQINVLGNHYGSFDLKLSYTRSDWSAHAYWQHYFEDKSGIEYANARDGLWGAEVELKKFPWLRKVVAEYFNTRDQSGPMHFITYDRPARGGGADNYYNNGEYTTGVSYFGRAIGSPLLTSPEYNTDGSPGFKNNRVKAFHLGAEGSLSQQIDYRLLLTWMNSWGTTFRPFADNKESLSGLLEIIYRHPRLQGWEFKGSAGADARTLYGNNLGVGIAVVKRGVLKKWNR